MEKKERSKRQKKAKSLIIVTGLLVLGSTGLTACTAKQAVAPVQTVITETTADPTNEVEETIHGEGEIGLTEQEETVYSMDKYGELGKQVFDNLASSWVKGFIKDEAELRDTMDAYYGELNTKEELTQEILAMPRETQPSQVAKETKAQKRTETKSNTQSGTGNSQNNTKSIQPTQPQAPPANSGTGFVPPPPEGDYWNSLTPEQRAELEAEAERRLQEAKDHPARVEERGGGDKMDWDPDEAASKWTWN